MIDLELAEKMLKGKAEYWVVNIRGMTKSIHGEKFPDKVVFICLPYDLCEPIEEPTIEQVKKLSSEYNSKNIYLSETHTPFQSCFSLYYADGGFPVEEKIREFIEKAITVKETHWYEYKKIYDELIKEG
jgi:hypothetical protein